MPDDPLIEVLTQLVSMHGAPRYLRSDNRPEFVACAILRWLHEAGIETALIDPGKPWPNDADESLNGCAATLRVVASGSSGKWSLVVAASWCLRSWSASWWLFNADSRS